MMLLSWVASEINRWVKQESARAHKSTARVHTQTAFGNYGLETEQGNIPDGVIGPKRVPLIPARLQLSAQAALATLLKHHNAQITPEELASFVAGNEQQVHQALVSCARQFGFLTFESTDGPSALYEELAADEPVMVLLNRGLNWWPVWQYAVVAGLDTQAQTFIVHTGENEPEIMPVAEFMGYWRGGRFWSLSLERPERIPKFAELERVLSTASVFTEGGQYDDAWAVYTAACERWPHKAEPLLGLGHIRYQEGHFQEAATWYQKALERPDRKSVV